MVNLERCSDLNIFLSKRSMCSISQLPRHPCQLFYSLIWFSTQFIFRKYFQESRCRILWTFAVFRPLELQHILCILCESTNQGTNAVCLAKLSIHCKCFVCRNRKCLSVITIQKQTLINPTVIFVWLITNISMSFLSYFNSWIYLKKITSC